MTPFLRMTRSHTLRPLTGALVCGLLTLAGQAGPAGAATPPKVIVSFTFDDALRTQEQVAPMLEAKGLAGTFYVNSNKVGKGLEHMSWDTLLQLQAAGHEIAGHGLDHVAIADDGNPATPVPTPAERTRQVCDDRTALIARGIAPPRSFAYPTGRWDDLAKAIVEGCGYTSGRTTTTWNQYPEDGPREYAEALPPAEPFAFRAETVMAKLGSTQYFLRDITRWAEEHDGGWIVLVIHDVCERPGRPTPYDAGGANPCRSAEEEEWSADPDDLREYIAWVAKRAGRGTVVMPVGDVLDMLNEPEQPPAACENGRDDDGDGLVDTTDPGCETPGDGDETDPPPPDPTPEPGPGPTPDPDPTPDPTPEPTPEPGPAPRPAPADGPVAAAAPPASVVPGPALAPAVLAPSPATPAQRPRPPRFDTRAPSIRRMTGIPGTRRVSRRDRRTLRLRVVARDDRRVVRAHFYKNGHRIRVDRRAPFTATWRTWRARPGVHRISVRVWDAAGNSARVTRVVRVTR